MKVQNITATEVVTVLQHHETAGATFAAIRISCPVKLLKKSRLDKSPCALGEVVKHSHLSVIINFDYEGNVNRQRVREGGEADFKTQENWFEHVSKAVVAHRKTGEQYAYVRVQKNIEAPTFTHNGAPIERAAVVAYLPSDDLTDEEREAAGLPVGLPNAPKQELEKEIQPIAVKLANIREILTCGISYSLTPEAITPEAITVTRIPRLLGTCDCKPSDFTGVDAEGDCTHCGRHREGAKRYAKATGL